MTNATSSMAMIYFWQLSYIDLGPTTCIWSTDHPEKRNCCILIMQNHIIRVIEYSMTVEQISFLFPFLLTKAVLVLVESWSMIRYCICSSILFFGEYGYLCFNSSGRWLQCAQLQRMCRSFGIIPRSLSEQEIFFTEARTDITVDEFYWYWFYAVI